tara:strand:- start:4257 stop:4979 length:723 start_codon:yes stop_codon:yes gene_type:complete
LKNIKTLIKEREKELIAFFKKQIPENDSIDDYECSFSKSSTTLNVMKPRLIAGFSLSYAKNSEWEAFDNSFTIVFSENIHHKNFINVDGSFYYLSTKKESLKNNIIHHNLYKIFDHSYKIDIRKSEHISSTAVYHKNNNDYYMYSGGIEYMVKNDIDISKSYFELVLYDYLLSYKSEDYYDEHIQDNVDILYSSLKEAFYGLKHKEGIDAFFDGIYSNLFSKNIFIESDLKEYLELNYSV